MSEKAYQESPTARVRHGKQSDRVQRTFLHVLTAVMVMAVLGILWGCRGNVGLPRHTQTVDGLKIELGVMPAELVTGHGTTPADPNAMHGGTPPNSSSNHIVVALFDAKTGARVIDAQVLASVSEPGYKYEPETALERMDTQGAISYGNFFLMHGAGVWRIHLVIHRPGTTRPVAADFAYEELAP